MKTVIFGCGGHARSVANVLLNNNLEEQMFFVDKNAVIGEMIFGFKVVREYDLNGNDDYIIAIGDNKKRRALYEGLTRKTIGRCISVISKNSSIGKEARIGAGVFIGIYVYVGPQAEIGDNTIINTGSIVEHETIIGDNTHIAPHVTICGRSMIGNNVLVGAGSVIIDQISICDDVIVGAGAVVRENITLAGTYAGVPAKKVK